MRLDYTPFQITKNFHSNEFNCNDYKDTPVPQQYMYNMIYLAVQLQKIRDYLQLNLVKINSAYRTIGHNDHIGGAKNSNHTTAQACDIVQFQLTKEQFYNAVKEMIKDGLIPDGEIINEPTWLHYAPNFEKKHYPQTSNSLYPDIEVHLFTYKSDIDHDTYQKIKKIRAKYQTSNKTA